MEITSIQVAQAAPVTCDPGRVRRVNFLRVLLSHEEAIVRWVKAGPGSNSSADFQAPARPKTAGPHASAQHTATVTGVSFANALDLLLQHSL
jgi:hypothetical protein